MVFTDKLNSVTKMWDQNIYVNNKSVSNISTSMSRVPEIIGCWIVELTNFCRSGTERKHILYLRRVCGSPMRRYSTA
jgi:hypothetical protein